ncbi:MAG: NAD(+)/NADH kinase [Oscillospiraceae bacterium]|nr:NAD(+)/NADH kinase [Oscillospiraceae bacterium]
MKLVIWPNLSKQHAFDTALAVCRLLASHGANICMDRQYESVFAQAADIRFLPTDQLMHQADFAIAIGGDGTILRCAEIVQGTDTKLVGINTGRLGFIAACESGEIDLLHNLFTDQYTISHRMMLQATFPSGKGDALVYHALNDVYATRCSGRICDFSVFVDEQHIGTYRADGIILSTPTGSTAYALSAGGPVMEPDLTLIEMNLICPHSLFARPMLFAPQRKIRVTYRVKDGGGLNVYVDGRSALTIQEGQSFTVTESTHTVPFVDFKGYGFYDALNGKLMQPLKDGGISKEEV